MISITLSILAIIASWMFAIPLPWAVAITVLASLDVWVSIIRATVRTLKYCSKE